MSAAIFFYFFLLLLLSSSLFVFLLLFLSLVRFSSLSGENKKPVFCPFSSQIGANFARFVFK